MSLAEHIETKLNEIMDKMAESLDVRPGPERGLAWGQADQARIVIPMEMVGRIAAGLAEEYMRDERAKGLAEGAKSTR